MTVDPNELLQQLYANDQGVGVNDPDNPAISPTASQPNAQPPSMTWDPVFGNNNSTYAAGQNWTSPNFQPTMPAPQLMSLDEMIDIINRRTNLATQPRLDALERSREEMTFQGEKQLGQVASGYNRARQDLQSDTNRSQQQMAQTTAARGIYDSGLAMKLGSQIARSGMEMGMQLGEAQAQQLADIAEYIYMSQRHNQQEIQSIMGEKAMMAGTLLDEMRLEQQNRGDVLAQREFENWLANQAQQLNEYWRQEEFDAGRADQEWNQWFGQEQMRIQQEQQEWDRVFNMNKWEAEHELQQLMFNNQISQQEFQNAMALDDFNLRKWLYQAQNRAPASVSYSQPAAPKASEGGMWWNLF